MAGPELSGTYLYGHGMASEMSLSPTKVFPQGGRENLAQLILWRRHVTSEEGGNITLSATLKSGRRTVSALGLHSTASGGGSDGCDLAARVARVAVIESNVHVFYLFLLC